MFYLHWKDQGDAVEILSARNPQNHQGFSTYESSTLIPAISISFPGMQLINNY